VSPTLNLLDCATAEPEEIEGFRHRSVRVGRELGAQLLGCSLYELPPGERVCPYHLHWANEEWLIVVAGSPTLRTPEGERVLAVGDVVAFPEGDAGAHSVSNGSDAPARVAIFSTRRHGSVTYPDSDKIGAGPPHERLYLHRGDAVDYWDGER
jgi:uncharacterized cupin superfamily protein